MSETIWEGKCYAIVLTDKAMNELGTACDAQGYAVINTDYGVTEYTTTMLGNAVMQATHSDNMVKTVLKTPAQEALDVFAVMEDGDVSVN